MKKITAIIVSALLAMVSAFGMAVPAAAVETDDAVKAQVQANRECQYPENLYISPAENGCASVTLDDGCVISGSGLPEEDCYFCVDFVVPEEADAFQWLGGLLADHGDFLDGWSIFLTDNEGNLLRPQKDFSVTFSSLPKGCTSLLAVGADEKIEAASLTKTHSAFRVSHFHQEYLAAVSQQENQTTPPVTGSKFPAAVLVVIAAGSACCVWMLRTWQKRGAGETANL